MEAPRGQCNAMMAAIESSAGGLHLERMWPRGQWMPGWLAAARAPLTPCAGLQRMLVAWSEAPSGLQPWAHQDQHSGHEFEEQARHLADPETGSEVMCLQTMFALAVVAEGLVLPAWWNPQMPELGQNSGARLAFPLGLEILQPHKAN